MMEAVKVKCWVCGYTTTTVVDEENKIPAMRFFLTVGAPEDLFCEKCGLQSMEQVEEE